MYALRLKLFFILTLAILVTSFVVTAHVTALTQNDLKSIIGGTVFYDPDDASSFCKTSAANIAGNDNIEKAYNYFVSKGLSPPQAAGIVGNLWFESGGVNPLATNSLGYHGIAQWDPKSRLPAERAFAQQQGRDPDSLDTQLDFVWEELHTTRVSALDPLLKTTDPTNAAIQWEKWYEGSGGVGMKSRIDDAIATLAKYGSNSPDANPVITTSCDTSRGEVIGNYSMPVARSWYDQHKDWFTKPHHDYPAADIPVPLGTPVFSMTAGKIIKAPAGKDCGYGVLVQAANGVQFIYCHGSDGGSVPGAKEGDEVQPGQLIMHSASTGDSSGPHLHVGIRVGGQNVCPQSLFVGIMEGTPPDINSLPSTGCFY